MAKCPSSYFPKNAAKVVLIAGAGALAYVGYKYYKNKVENATKKDKAPPKVETDTPKKMEPAPKPEPQVQPPSAPKETPQPTDSFVIEPEVQPPSLPKSGDATPQPTESFVLIPPKDQDDKSQAEFDPSVDTTPLKNSDEENSFIKVPKDEEDKLPQKLDVSDMPLPIQKLDELANIVESLEEQMKHLPETLAEAEKLEEESSSSQE